MKIVIAATEIDVSGTEKKAKKKVKKKVKQLDPKKYKWLEYAGRPAKFEGAGKGSDEYFLELKKGEKFGIKRIKDTTYMLFASELTLQLRLTKFDANRIIKNSKSWSGKIGRSNVEAAVGGLNGTNDTMRDIGKDLKRIKVDSSMFIDLAYERKRKRLYVQFKNGALWVYDSVTPEEALEFEEAESQGRWFNQNIKNVKDGQRAHSNDSLIHKSKAMESGRNKIN